MKSLLGDLNKDGKMSGYEQARQDAIEKNMKKPREGFPIGGIARAAAKQMAKLFRPKRTQKEYWDGLREDYLELSDSEKDALFKKFNASMEENSTVKLSDREFDMIMWNEVGEEATDFKPYYQMPEEYLIEKGFYRKPNFSGGLLDDDNSRLGFAEGQDNAEMQNYRTILAGLRQLPENDLPAILALAQEGKPLPEQYMVKEEAGVVMNPINAQKNHPDLFMKALNFLQEPREGMVFGGLTKLLSKGAKSLMDKAKSTNPKIQKELDKVGNEILKFQDRPMKKGETIFLEGIGEVPGRPVKTLDSGSLEEISKMILDNGGDLNDVVRYFEKINKAQKNNKIESLNDILDEIENEFFPRTKKFDGGEMEMLPDEIMEQNFIDFVVGEALSEKEESMLNEQLEANPELSVLFDKVVEKASEFTGAGPVEGPGTGTSDDIPARLSDGEFVFTAKAVEQIGADNLMKMMKEAEAAYDAGSEREGYANGEEVKDDKKVTVEYVQGQQQVTPNQSLLGGMPLYEEDESSKINKESMRLNPTRHVYS